MEDRIIKKIKIFTSLILIAIFLFGFINTLIIVAGLQDLKERLDNIENHKLK